MTADQVHELAQQLRVLPETEAEMQIKWAFARERYTETGEHIHACPDCGKHYTCRNPMHETDRAYHGRDLLCEMCFRR